MRAASTGNDGEFEEAIDLLYMPGGTYEVLVYTAKPLPTDVNASVKIEAIGKKRTFNVTLPAGQKGVRVARVKVASEWQ